MAKVNNFEDLEMWKAGCRLTTSVYKMTEIASLKKEWALIDQMKRSALSIPSNIAEGFERGSDRDFVKFLWIAKGSAGELRTQLYVAAKLGKVAQKDVKRLIEESRAVSKQISKFITYLLNSIENK